MQSDTKRAHLTPFTKTVSGKGMARCLLLEAKLPKRMWTYAVMSSVYIRSRCFCLRLGKTPYKALIGKQPNISAMHIFGSTFNAFIKTPRN